MDNAQESGATAVVFALVLFVLLGFSALAVDLSGFFEDARHQQTFADLACLAGARHLPEDPALATQKAGDNIKENLNEFQGAGDPVNGAAWTAGDYTVTITAPYGGDATNMRVAVEQTSPTWFGKLLDTDDVTVNQRATCGVFSLGGGSLPYGTFPTGFNGTLLNDAPCGEDEGNCWQLDVPRSDVPSGGPVSKRFHLNNAWGADRVLERWDGTDIVCTSSTDPCNVVDAKQGVTQGQLSDAVVRERSIPEVGGNVDGRLRDLSQAVDTYTTPQGRVEDDTELDDLFETATPPSVPPNGFDSGLYGPWQHHYVTEIKAEQCAHPRFGAVPIVVRHSDGAEAWPSGSSGKMRVMGMRWIYIDEPDDPSHHSASDDIETIEAQQLWFAPDVVCSSADGDTMPFEPGSPKVVKLVAND